MSKLYNRWNQNGPESKDKQGPTSSTYPGTFFKIQKRRKFTNHKETTSSTQSRPRVSKRSIISPVEWISRQATRTHPFSHLKVSVISDQHCRKQPTPRYSCISTKGGRIKTVVRSSTEAEISAVNEIASDILWCRDVLEELGYKQDPIPIMEDNQSCITMLQTEPRNFHTKSRHVRVKWAFFREEYANKTIFLRYCPTASMVADLLTKPLGSRAHNLLSTAILNGSEP